jgi:hypothetical protein
MTVHLILVVAACICFVLAAAGVPSRIGLTPLGLLFLTLALFLA